MKQKTNSKIWRKDKSYIDVKMKKKEKKLKTVSFRTPTVRFRIFFKNLKKI